MASVDVDSSATAVFVILRGQHIALIDDVMMTGTSLDELATKLKRAGARE